MIKIILKKKIMKEIRRLIEIARQGVKNGKKEYDCFNFVQDYLDFIWKIKLISRKNIDVLWRELQDATESTL